MKNSSFLSIYQVGYIWRVLHVIWHLLLLKKTNSLFCQGDQKDRRMNVCLLFFNQNMALTSKQCNSLLNCFGNKYWCEKKTKLIVLVQGKVCTYKLTILAISPSVTWDPNILWLPMKLDDSGSVVSVMEEPQEQSGQNKLLAGGKIKRHHRFIWHRGLLSIVDNMPQILSQACPQTCLGWCYCLLRISYKDCFWMALSLELLNTAPYIIYLIFVTDATDGVCGEKLVMWRNSPHDLLSSGKFLHIINVETILSSGGWIMFE